MQLFQYHINPLTVIIVDKQICKKMNPTGILFTYWNILFTNLKEQLHNRKFTLCLQIFFVNITEDSLPCVVHLPPFLSTAIKSPFLLSNKNQLGHTTP